MGDTLLAGFNAMPAARAAEHLLGCCASRRWASAVAGGRPYPSVAALVARSDRELGRLAWADVVEALDAHPRIGDAPGATPGAEHSRREQAGVAGADPATLAALAAATRRYEERFGHVFLVRAAGRSAGQILAELHTRLGNDVARERAAVLRELTEITRLRLAAWEDS